MKTNRLITSIFFGLSAIFLSFAALPPLLTQTALAAKGTTPGGGTTPGNNPSGGFQIPNPLKDDTIPEILNTVAGFLYTLAIAVVTIMVLWGGFQILTAAGSPERIDRGKKTLLYAVIGTVVILIAGGIADLTADILGGGTGGTQPGPPAGSTP